MIPSPSELAEGYRFLARAWGVRAAPDLDALAALHALAVTLAGDPGDEPAALFFAAARYPTAFPGLHAAVAERLAINSAAARGLRVEPAQLRPWHVPILRGRVGWEPFRAWFAALPPRDE